MDQLDLQILRAMGSIPFADGPRPWDASEPRPVAQRLEENPALVRERIGQLESEGVVSRYTICVNLNHLGLGQTTYLFTIAPTTPHDTFDQLQMIDGVVGVRSFVGPHVSLDFCYSTQAQLQRNVAQVQQFMRPLATSRFYECPRPPISHHLDTTDWRIIRALRGKARRPFSEVGLEVGLSAKTVHRRIDRMATRGDIDILPIVDHERMAGRIPVYYTVQFARGASPDATRGMIEATDNNWRCYWVPPEAACAHLAIAAFAYSPREAEQVRQRMQSIPSVQHVDVLLPANNVEHCECIDDLIEQRCAANTHRVALARTSAKSR